MLKQKAGALSGKVESGFPSESASKKTKNRSRRRQYKLGAQTADRGAAEREAAAIKAGQLDHDREPKS
jgi:hypothetical protein